MGFSNNSPIRREVFGRELIPTFVSHTPYHHRCLCRQNRGLRSKYSSDPTLFLDWHGQNFHHPSKVFATLENNLKSLLQQNCLCERDDKEKMESDISAGDKEVKKSTVPDTDVMEAQDKEEMEGDVNAGDKEAKKLTVQDTDVMEAQDSTPEQKQVQKYRPFKTSFDLSGMDPDTIKVELKNGNIRICGKKENKVVENGWTSVHSAFVTYERSIPSSVKEEDMSAVLSQNGLLTIQEKKNAESREISTEESDLQQAS